MPGYRTKPLPDGGAWRVHPDPGRLPRLADEGPGRNRYDDPQGAYGVRYVADRLTGALVETMARFRPVPQAETRLARVSGVEPDDLDVLDPVDGVRDWLDAQSVGRVKLEEPSTLVDVHDNYLLSGVAKHPLVLEAIERSGLGTRRSPATLDEGVIRLAGPLGRPITQAVGRAIREWVPEVAGIAYCSRLDDEEWCWALWEETPVLVEVERLDPGRRHHRQAVQHAATLLEVSLPSEWT